MSNPATTAPPPVPTGPYASAGDPTACMAKGPGSRTPRWKCAPGPFAAGGDPAAPMGDMLPAWTEPWRAPCRRALSRWAIDSSRELPGDAGQSRWGASRLTNEMGRLAWDSSEPRLARLSAVNSRNDSSCVEWEFGEPVCARGVPGLVLNIPASTAMGPPSLPVAALAWGGWGVPSSRSSSARSADPEPELLMLHDARIFVLTAPISSCFRAAAACGSLSAAASALSRASSAKICFCRLHILRWGQR
mmetsp:Transcript_19547/g.48990  ORF Transcript_19547/g.48990 Transcript_19547/m.48990 type:complete len:247 (+) Transcript_19547:505-1245(+)